MTEQRNAALAQFAQQAEAQSKKLALNLWVLPVSPSVITAEFGEYGLWASYHTGLDFNGSEGQPIMADRQRRRHLRRLRRVLRQQDRRHPR